MIRFGFNQRKVLHHSTNKSGCLGEIFLFRIFLIWWLCHWSYYQHLCEKFLRRIFHFDKSFKKMMLWTIVLKTKNTARGRVEICRDRHDQRSCKICASCVNFPGNQRDVSHNLRRTTKFTHTKCDFSIKHDLVRLCFMLYTPIFGNSW